MEISLEIVLRMWWFPYKERPAFNNNKTVLSYGYMVRFGCMFCCNMIMRRFVCHGIIGVISFEALLFFTSTPNCLQFFLIYCPEVTQLETLIISNTNSDRNKKQKQYVQTAIWWPVVVSTTCSEYIVPWSWITARNLLFLFSQSLFLPPHTHTYTNCFSICCAFLLLNSPLAIVRWNTLFSFDFA